MKTSSQAFSVMVGAATLLAALAPFASAQWADYPSGAKPAMDGPTPKTADGKPNLSGVWTNGRAGGGGGGGRGAAGGRGGGGQAVGQAGRGAAAAAAAPPSDPNPIPIASFQNIGSGFKEGLPLKPWAAELLAARKSENSKDNPDAHCLPLGLTQLHMHPQPRKIIQTPGVVIILYEAQGGVRQIFTDGRSLPPKDVQPWWYGYSIGRWEGDTLVVETTGFRDDVWLDINGSPMTNAGKLIEKFRRPNYGSLDIEVTVDDPTAYTKPFTVRFAQRLMANTDLIEFICNENEKSDAHLVGK